MRKSFFISACAALKRLRKLQICLINHISRRSNFAPYFLSVYGRMTHIYYVSRLLDSYRTNITSSTDNSIQNLYMRRLLIRYGIETSFGTSLYSRCLISCLYRNNHVSD